MHCRIPNVTTLLPYRAKRKNTPVSKRNPITVLHKSKHLIRGTHTHVNVHLPCFVYKSTCTMEWKNSQYIYSTWEEEKKKIDDIEQDREIKKKKDIYLLFNAIPKALNRIFEQDFWTILRIQMLKRGCSNARSVNVVLILLLHSSPFVWGSSM